jgi:hypothetical protein
MKPIKNLPVGQAPQCKCGCGAITEWNRRKNGWNVYVEGHYRKPFPYKNKEWLESQYESGRTLQEIADEFGVINTTIKKFISKFGIVLRSHSENLRLRGSMVGDKNPSWKGGVTPDRQRIYKTNDWIKLVKYIYKRDGYKCQRCGIGHNGQNKLHAHHLKSWADNPALRLSESNLITLCNSCHVWVHSRKNINSDFIY